MPYKDVGLPGSVQTCNCHGNLNKASAGIEAAKPSTTYAYCSTVLLNCFRVFGSAEAGCSGNQQSDTDEPMGNTPEAEHMCVLVYGGFSGDAVEGDLISIDPGVPPA